MNRFGEVAFRFLETIPGVSFEKNAEFGKRTTYRVGGRCSILVSCESTRGLEQSLACLGALPVYVLGNGSNTLVSENGFEGAVIRLVGEFEEVAFSGETVTLGSAVPLPAAARKISSHGLSGMEWAVGIPGTVGGALKMNAGGHGSETSRWIRSAVVYRHDVDGYARCESLPADLELEYRHSNLGDRDIAVSASFQLRSGDESESKRLISEIVAWRREHQPGGQNAGSVFVNPPGDHSARLIESLGLKGCRLGTAEVSSKHANFIQSEPGGSSEDVFELIWLVQQKVEVELGIRLRTEIKLVGFDWGRSRYLRGEKA